MFGSNIFSFLLGATATYLFSSTVKNNIHQIRVDAERITAIDENVKNAVMDKLIEYYENGRMPELLREIETYKLLKAQGYNPNITTLTAPPVAMTTVQ